MRSINTQRDSEEKRLLYLFPYSFFDSANGKLCAFYLEISHSFSMGSLYISIQRHFIASEKLVKKDTRWVMKDKCLIHLKFYFIRKLTTKKLCPFAIENLHPALHSKIAPEPLVACQILHNNSLR